MNTVAESAITEVFTRPVYLCTVYMSATLLGFRLTLGLTCHAPSGRSRATLRKAGTSTPWIRSLGPRALRSWDGQKPSVTEMRFEYKGSSPRLVEECLVPWGRLLFTLGPPRSSTLPRGTPGEGLRYSVSRGRFPHSDPVPTPGLVVSALLRSTVYNSVCTVQDQGVSPSCCGGQGTYYSVVPPLSVGE